MKDLQKLGAMAQAVGDIYADRFDVERDATFYLGKMMEEMGEVSAAYLKLTGRARGADGAPDVLRGELEDELADLFGFLLLFARWQGVDLGAALDKKWGAYLQPAEDACDDP
ncbi:hypothetical protein shim_36250 [Shimia sp. SK013]|uniref:hypothetical protein n=1 Tax=Shimia sp. SK013 TaxID=1389006 RepID=UPI0006CD0248|nr:hypothetical protein [Shimia sp. SK013]KPA20127.1 hypothetical protein shim_36250 [Shimia sp. SK013]